MKRTKIARAIVTVISGVVAGALFVNFGTDRPNPARVAGVRVAKPTSLQEFFPRAKPATVAKIAAGASARGWTPGKSTFNTSIGRRPRGIARPVQDEVFTPSGGEISVWDWNTGNPDTMAATIAVEIYSTGEYLLYELELDVTDAENWDQTWGDILDYDSGSTAPSPSPATQPVVVPASFAKGDRVASTPEKNSCGYDCECWLEGCCIGDDWDPYGESLECLFDNAGSLFKKASMLGTLVSRVGSLVSLAKYVLNPSTSVSLSGILAEIVVGEGQNALEDLLTGSFANEFYDCRLPTMRTNMANFYCGVGNWDWHTTDNWECDNILYCVNQ